MMHSLFTRHNKKRIIMSAYLLIQQTIKPLLYGFKTFHIRITQLSLPISLRLVNSLSPMTI